MSKGAGRAGTYTYVLIPTPPVFRLALLAGDADDGKSLFATSWTHLQMR